MTGRCAAFTVRRLALYFRILLTQISIKQLSPRVLACAFSFSLKNLSIKLKKIIDLLVSIPRYVGKSIGKYIGLVMKKYFKTGD